MMVEGSETPDTINIQLRIDARAEYDGKVSGRHYIWHKAGDFVPVAPEDVPELLSKRLGKKYCCGGADSNRIFEIMGG